MLDFLIYTIEAGVIFAIFTATYRYVYRGTSYYKWERGYLLISTALSYALPFMKITHTTTPRVMRPLDRVVDVISIGDPSIVTLQHEKADASPIADFLSSQLFDTIVTILFAVYAAGVVVKMVSFVNGIRKTMSLVRIGVPVHELGSRVYRTSVNTVAFSFLGNTFLGKKSDGLSLHDLDVVLSHEREHIRGRHSLDTLVFGFFSVIQWMNPMVRIAARESRAICENIADQKAADGGVSEYSRLVLRLGMSKRSGAGESHSSGNLLDRIARLLSDDSQKVRRIRFVATLPILAIVIAAYIVVGGMWNPSSSGLRVPLMGKYKVSAGYFENQDIMTSDGEILRLSHRQVDFSVRRDLPVTAPISGIASVMGNDMMSITDGEVVVILGGVVLPREKINNGDAVSRGQIVAATMGDRPFTIRVEIGGRVVNPELMFRL